MPVRISNCVFVNNTPAQSVDTLTLQGGGLCIQGPASDSTDDPMSQHGFLQKLSITMTRTRVDGNMAAEGGGLWTAWPMIIEDCSFRNNHAVVSVSVSGCCACWDFAACCTSTVVTATPQW
jgi:hypothetical protein